MPDYATLAQVKARSSIASATTTHDTIITAAIAAASRMIDQDCGRIFHSVSTTKYFTPDNALTLFVPDDVQSISTLQTVSSSGSGTRVYGFTWSATDYDLEPADGPPYTRIVVNDTGQYQFPTRRRGALVTGVFGYNLTGYYPDAINEACIRQASRLFERNKVPLGAIGSAEFDGLKVASGDPDYQNLIMQYRRYDAVVTTAW